MFNHDPGTTVVHKRMSFFSVLAVGVTTVVVTVIACASGLAVFGLRLADRKSDSVIGLVQQVTGNLPELQHTLPPALADALNDERRPVYADELKVAVRLSKRESRGRLSPAIVEVENKGDQIVSLLSMRVVSVDEGGDATQERSVWVSTPLQVGNHWRGPLLPHETRRLLVWGFDRSQIAQLTHEITDLRIWRGDRPLPAAEKAAASHAKERRTAESDPADQEM